MFVLHCLMFDACCGLEHRPGTLAIHHNANSALQCTIQFNVALLSALASQCILHCAIAAGCNLTSWHWWKVPSIAQILGQSGASLHSLKLAGAATLCMPASVHHKDHDVILEVHSNLSQERVPELEVHGLDGEAILLIELTCQLQTEVRLPRRTLGTHLGSGLCSHVRHVEDIPQQAAFCMVPAGQIAHIHI